MQLSSMITSEVFPMRYNLCLSSVQLIPIWLNKSIACLCALVCARISSQRGIYNCAINDDIMQHYHGWVM